MEMKRAKHELFRIANPHTGIGIHVGQGRVRESSKTEIDGADSLEKYAKQQIDQWTPSTNRYIAEERNHDRPYD